MTPDETTVVLKSVSRSIISIRKRMDDRPVPEELQRELDLLISARNKLEGDVQAA